MQSSRSGGARDASSHLGKPLAEGGLVGAHWDGDFFAVGEDGEAFGDFDGMGADFYHSLKIGGPKFLK